MIAVALSFLFALALVLGIGAPMATGELAAGRAAFLGLQAARAADGTLGGWPESSWLDSTVTGPIGTGVGFDSIEVGTRIMVRRRLERIGDELWLLEATALVRDANRGIRARARRGWLVKVGRDSADSSLYSVVISRGKVPAFQ